MSIIKKKNREIKIHVHSPVDDDPLRLGLGSDDHVGGCDEASGFLQQGVAACQEHGPTT